jgi:hypothetical protein
MRNFSAFAAVLLALCIGCAAPSSLQAPTAKAIGCATADVQIAQDVGGFGSRTWIAHCGERRYECSSERNDPQPECLLAP